MPTRSPKRRAAAIAQRPVKMWEIGAGMSALEAILPTPGRPGRLRGHRRHRPPGPHPRG
jgi:hypothetical protein